MEEKMEDTRFTTRQVGELLKIEDARLKRGESGVRQELQALIDRLKSGGVAGKSNDLREIQAKRLWDLGVGHELDFPSFEKYLATIPKIPPTVHLYDGLFIFLILVEPRLPLKMICALANVDFGGGDKTTFINMQRDEVSPYWIRVQNGCKNRNRSVEDCRRNFTRDELGLTALEGVAAYVHHPEVVADLTQRDGHAMYLPGSMLRAEHQNTACLSVNGGRARLDWHWDGVALPDHGSASRRAA